jgi:hypothetical protein
MGNTTSIGDPNNCAAENGVLITDDSGSKCYISSTTVNVKGLKSIQPSSNTTVQAFNESDGFGREQKLTFGISDVTNVKSLKITVNLSGGAIAGIVIGAIILTFILSYGGYHGYKHYRKRWRSRNLPILTDSIDGDSVDFSPYSSDNPMSGGYQKFRY